MAVIKVYTRINWLNKSESLTTPLGKTNLNKMDKAINLIDDEVVSMSAKVDEIDTTKVSADQLNNMVTDVSFNDRNGVISITKYNGTVLNIDTAMEKIAVNFEYNAQTQQLILTLENGEKQYIDMSALITQYEFKDTDTIAFSIDSDGKVSASIKSGSITKAMLSSEVMSAVTLSENNAAASAQAAAQSATNAELDAKLSQSYSVGKSGIRDGEDIDNAKYYKEQAQDSSDSASNSASSALASSQTATTKASEAATSATNASKSESNANTSATNARNSATSASSSATTATSKANEAKSSASAAAQSATNADMDAKLSQSYSVGKSGIRDGEDTDNSKYYSEQAKKYADEAQEIAGGNFIPKSEKGVANGVAVLNANLAVEKAVADEDGNNIQDTYVTQQQVPTLVKVDDKTITKDEDGTLHGAMSVEVDSELSATSMNPVQNKVITQALQEKANTDNVDALNRTVTKLQENKADKTEVPKLVKVDGTTITMDDATKIIKIAQTLQTKINSIDTKLAKANVVNNLVTTEEGYALDARQGAALDEKIAELNDSLSVLRAVKVFKNIGGITIKLDGACIDHGANAGSGIRYTMADKIDFFYSKQGYGNGYGTVIIKQKSYSDQTPVFSIVNGNSSMLTVSVARISPLTLSITHVYGGAFSLNIEYTPSITTIS